MPGNRGQAKSRGMPGDPWTWDSSRNSRVVLQWPDTEVAVNNWQLELHQWLSERRSSPEAQKVNPGIELLVLLICLFWLWVETEWQRPNRWVQEQDGFHCSDLYQCHFVYWRKGCGDGGTTVNCLWFKPGASSFLEAQDIALVSLGKQYWLAILRVPSKIDLGDLQI